MKTFFALLSLAFLSGCSSLLVGMPIPQDYQTLCKIETLPTICSFNVEWHMAWYTIDNGSAPHEYVVNGKYSYNPPGTKLKAVSGNVMFFLLADDREDYVVSNVKKESMYYTEAPHIMQYSTKIKSDKQPTALIVVPAARFINY